jgi:hypothetical protein
LGTDVTGIAFGFAVKFPTIEDSDISTFMQLLSSGTYCIGIGLLTSGAVRACRQSARTTVTSLGESPAGKITAAAWHYIEAEIEIHNTTGEFRIYIDGESTPSVDLSGVDTDNAVADVNEFALGFASSGDYVEFDDLYVKEGATRLGPQRIQTVRVSADGGTLDWAPSTGTDHYAVLDDSVIVDTDYVSASAVGNTDTFALADITNTPLEIHEVNLIAYAKKTDASARAIKLGMTSDATLSESADSYLADSVTRHSFPLVLDPDGGVAWTKAAVNALVPQIKVSV